MVTDNPQVPDFHNSAKVVLNYDFNNMTPVQLDFGVTPIQLKMILKRLQNASGK